jgi:phage terminase large subunit-like protein
VPFDEDKANRGVLFFERYLRHTKGRFANTPFLLYDWQKELVREMFGRMNEDGTRQYRQVFLEVPRKNGKSEMAAGVALKLLLADGEPSAEIYSAASDREQAANVYDVAAQMVRNQPAFSRRVRITDSRRNIAVPKTASKYRVVSADGGRQHGLNPSGVIFDEVHTQRRRGLWDAMTMGSDTRTQPLFFAITTAGVPDEAPVWWDLHEYARQVREGVFKDSTFLAIHYGAQHGDDFDDPAVWRKANPALGTFLDFDKFEANWRRARRIPSEWNEWLRYRLNVPTQQSDRWLDLQEWDACGERIDWGALNGVECVCGVDLSSRSDITALVLLFRCADGMVRVRPYFWLPEERVPSRLKPWVHSGLIQTTPGGAVDYGYIRKTIGDLRAQYSVKSLLFDEWNAQQIGAELIQDGLNVMTTRFGPRSMTGPAKELESLIGSRSIRHDGNPVLRWMVDCVSIRSDASGNICPVKPDRLKSEKRIDGVAAMCMGLSALLAPEKEQTVAYFGLRTVG